VPRKIPFRGLIVQKAYFDFLGFARMERFPCTKLISTSRDRLAQPQLIIAKTVSTAIDKSQNVVASSRLLIYNTEISTSTNMALDYGQCRARSLAPTALEGHKLNPIGRGGV
jgi:hypothetical protein